MNVPPDSPLTGDLHVTSAQSPSDLHPASIFEPLTTRDLDLLLALVTAGRRMVSAVHPLLCPLWQELGDVITDLSAAWWVAFDRENPGTRTRRPLATTGRCVW
jgi:hypothetical protein